MIVVTAYNRTDLGTKTYLQNQRSMNNLTYINMAWAFHAYTFNYCQTVLLNHTRFLRAKYFKYFQPTECWNQRFLSIVASNCERFNN